MFEDVIMSGDGIVLSIGGVEDADVSGTPVDTVSCCAFEPVSSCLIKFAMYPPVNPANIANSMHKTSKNAFAPDFVSLRPCTNVPVGACAYCCEGMETACGL